MTSEDPTLEEIKKLAYDIVSQKKDVEQHLKKCQEMYNVFKKNEINPLIIELAEFNLSKAESNLSEICTIETRMEQILRRIQA